MTDPTPQRDATDTATPRWVKVFGIVAVVLVLLFAVLLLLGDAGGHGPGRHALSMGGAGVEQVAVLGGR